MSGQRRTSQPTKQPPQDRLSRVRVWLVMAAVFASAAVAIAGIVVDHPTTCARVPRCTSC